VKSAWQAPEKKKATGFAVAFGLKAISTGFIEPLGTRALGERRHPAWHAAASRYEKEIQRE
jgi:hypothetical protein